VTDTEILTNTATRTIHLSSDGAGTVFAVGKDWSKIVSFDAASSAINWTVDYAADAATFDSAVYAGSLLFAAGGGVVFSLDPADGSIIEEHGSSALNAICEYDGNAAYATSLTTIDPSTGATIVLAGPVNVLDGTTGALTESFPLEADFVRLSGTVDGKLLVVSVNTSPGSNPYYGHIYGPAPDLPGGTVKIYQMSSIVGRGYPASITI
jgi:outer membrane protein assembly factor BamB